MKKIKYFFETPFNLIFIIGSLFVLLDMKFNFFYKPNEGGYSEVINKIFSGVGVSLWVVAFVLLVILSNKSYKSK